MEKTLPAYLCLTTQLGYHQTPYTLTPVKLLHNILKVILTNKATVSHYSFYLLNH